MAIGLRHSGSDTSPEPKHEHPKSDYVQEYPEAIRDEDDAAHLGRHTSLHRGLKARHITMIAIGGAIGTGLIIGTGAALAKAGPASILISYTLVGALVYIVMTALGEMAAWLPLGSGFAGYATRFCDPALGFALGWTYWFKYIITTPNQLVASSLVLSYWSHLNPGIWIAIFLVTIIIINVSAVRLFGEFEFWLSSIKVAVICGVIITSLVIALGGGPDHDRRGFRYYHDPGAFKPYIKQGSAGKFLGFWSSMITAVFAYLGTELVGVTVGEAQNPRKTIPRAIKLTFFRILFFYILAVFLLTMCVPYNSTDLIFANKQSTSAAASPFVVAIKNAHISGLAGFLNGCILIFTLSAANSDLYIGSRTIYGLAVQGKAPKFLAYTDKRGVPIWSLAISASFCLLAMMAAKAGSKVVFGYFVNLVTIFGLLTWISILVTHIYFRKARVAQGILDSQMPYVAPLGITGSYVAVFFCCLIALTKNFNVFVHDKSYGKLDYKNFITGYLGIPLYLIMIFGYKLWFKTKTVRPEEADFYSGKATIDREEEEFLARKAAEGKLTQRRHWFYRTFIAWLF